MERQPTSTLTALVLQWLDRDSEAKSQLQSDLDTFGTPGVRRQALYDITNTRALHALRESIVTGGGPDAIDWDAVRAYLSRSA